MKTLSLSQRGEEVNSAQYKFEMCHFYFQWFCSCFALRSLCPRLRCSQGLVVVWELQLERRGRPERVSVSWEHRGQAISALCWDTSALRVFVGDSTGRVTFLRAGSSKLGKVGADSLTRLTSLTAVSLVVISLCFACRGRHSSSFLFRRSPRWTPGWSSWAIMTAACWCPP